MLRRLKHAKDAAPRLRHITQCTWTQERIDWSKALCERFLLHRSDMFMQGHVYMLELWDDILAQITMGNYVKCYRVKSSHVIRSYPKRANTNYIIMYVYGIFMRGDGMYVILYKDNDSSDQDNILTWYATGKRLDEDILDMFPLGMIKGIPD